VSLTEDSCPAKSRTSAVVREGVSNAPATLPTKKVPGRFLQLDTCFEEAPTYTIMSAEEGSGQPPAAGTDKGQPAKPAAAFTSSFINSGLRRVLSRTMLNDD
jgi:hypothetical protein